MRADSAPARRNSTPPPCTATAHRPRMQNDPGGMVWWVVTLGNATAGLTGAAAAVCSGTLPRFVAVAAVAGGGEPPAPSPSPAASSAAGAAAKFFVCLGTLAAWLLPAGFSLPATPPRFAFALAAARPDGLARCLRILGYGRRADALMSGWLPVVLARKTID